jgi:hypothetical protein
MRKEEWCGPAVDGRSPVSLCNRSDGDDHKTRLAASGESIAESAHICPRSTWLTIALSRTAP